MKYVRFSTLTAICIIAVMVFSNSGCEKNEDFNKDKDHEKIADCFVTSIFDIQAPGEIKAGEPTEFLVKYIKPTPCEEFKGFHVHTSGNTLSLEVCLKLYDGPCITVLDEGEATFIRTFSEPGLYKIKYKEWDEEKVLEINVI